MTVRIPQLRHPNGFLINSGQEMAGLLKSTLLDFFREDDESSPVLQPHTQTRVADPLITEMECKRATLTLIRALGLLGFSLRPSKPLALTLPLC